MVQEILAKYLTKNFSKIKFGGGVVGKCTYLSMVLLFLFITALCRIKNEWIILMIVLAAALVTIYFVNKILRFAEQHKEVAILDGMEFVAYKQMEATQMSSNKPTLTNNSLEKSGLVQKNDK